VNVIVELHERIKR
jgi:hypothetical protein